MNSKNLAQLAIVALLLFSLMSMASARTFIQEQTNVWGDFWKVVNVKPYCRIYSGLLQRYLDGGFTGNNLSDLRQENNLRYQGLATCLKDIKGNVTTAELGQPAASTTVRQAEEPAAFTYDVASNREIRQEEVVARTAAWRAETSGRAAIRNGDVKGEFLTKNFTSVDDIAKYRDQVTNGTLESRPYVRYYAQNCVKYPLSALVELAKTGTTSYMSLSDTQKTVHEFTMCFKELVDDVLASTGKTDFTITRGVVSGTQGEMHISVAVGPAVNPYPPECTKKYTNRWVEYCKTTGACPTGLKQACGLS